MFEKRRNFSYVAQKERRHHLLKAVLFVVVFFLVFGVVSASLGRTIIVRSSGMTPGIHIGDCLIVSSSAYGFRVPFSGNRVLPFSSTNKGRPKRGDIVLVETVLTSDGDNASAPGFWISFVDSVFRFFTLQRYGFIPSSEGAPRYRLERVVGLPGDELSMSGFVLKIRAEGDQFALTEFELSKVPYDIKQPSLPSGWDRSLPLSSELPPQVLGPDEYYLVSDDRSASADSRTYGPVSLSDICGKIVARYWPLSRIRLF